MLIRSYLLCANLLFVYVAQTKGNIQCDINKAICENEGDAHSEDLERKKLIFYDVNPPEGFNLRRDVYMRFAIMLAEAQKQRKRENWHLILPPWFGLYHWKSESFHDPPKPWSLFFDVPSLKSYAPVLELHDVMHTSGRYGLKIDSLYILQNYDDPFENGEFRDMWNILGPCRYNNQFWGYNNITAKRVICVQFQGSIDKLWELIDTEPSDRKIMISHGEIPLHSSYGTKTYWDCRKSMKFNHELVKEADAFIIDTLNCKEPKCNNYLSVHWRRQDFQRADRSPSIKSTAEQIHSTIKKKSLKIANIYIASDGTNEELTLLETELKKLAYKVYFYIPDISSYADGQIAIIEQIICSRSDYFIGTHESTFTYRIQEEREILGYDSDTTFNRLCPDVGECERPSRWKIVH